MKSCRRHAWLLKQLLETYSYFLIINFCHIYKMFQIIFIWSTDTVNYKRVTHGQTKKTLSNLRT